MDIIAAAIGEAVKGVLDKLSRGKRLATEDLLVLHLAATLEEQRRIRQELAEIHRRIDEMQRRMDVTNRRLDSIQGGAEQKNRQHPGGIE